MSATTFVDVLRQAGWRTALVGKAHLQNISGLPPVWPPANRRLSREAKLIESGDFEQEWSPRWRAKSDFDIRPPFYGFETVRLAIDHGDEALGHYARWLNEEHPEIAAVVGPEHALPSADYKLVKSRQA